MRKKLFSMVLLLAVAMVSFVSCSNDDGGTPKLAPSIVQSEQTSENPITLAFSWTDVEASSYTYELSTETDGQKTVVTSGTTDRTSVEIVASNTINLSFYTK